MADEAGGPGNGLFYALLGGLCIVVAGGGLYIYQNSGNLLDTASPPPLASVQPIAPSAREIADIRTARGNRITTLVGTARAAIDRRDYAAADRALDEAEHIDSHDPAVVRTRSELAEAANRPGRRD